MFNVLASHHPNLRSVFAAAVVLCLAATPSLSQAPELVAEQTSEIFLDKDGSGGITAGDLIQYEVTITNIGTAADLEVIFDETIANGATLEAGSVVVTSGDVALGNNDEDPQVIVEAEMLDPATAMTITFQARVDNTLTSEAVDVSNQGSVTSGLGHPTGLGTDDPNTAEVGDATVTDLDRPNLGVSVTDEGGAVEPGQTIVYTVAFENSGSSHAEAGSITETVPDGTTFNATESSAGWDCADGAPGGTVCTYELGFVDIDECGSLDFAVDVLPTAMPGVTQIINLAAIGDDGSHGADEDASDNLQVLVTGVGVDLDLELAATPTLDPIMAGAVQVYEFTVTNHGPLVATGVELDYELPEGVEYVGADLGEPDCLEAAGTVMCQITDLGASASASVFVTVRIDPFFDGELSASASVDADQAESAAANNSISLLEQVDPLVASISLPDIDGNGADELAVLTFHDGASTIVVSDAQTGSEISRFTLSSEYLPVDIERLDDFDGSDADELVILAKDPVSGASRLFVRDAGDGELLTVRGLSDSHVPYDIEIVPDMSSNGVDEVAVLEIDPVVGERRVTLKDPVSGPTLQTATLDSDRTPIDFERTSDGRLAVLELGTDGAAAVSFRDELDGSDLGEIAYSHGWSASELEVVADFDGNSADELAVLMRQNTTAKARVFVTDSVTASEDRIAMDDTMVARDLEVVENFSASSAQELAIALRAPDGSNQEVWIKDASSKKTIRKIFQTPSKVVHDVSIVADFAETSADEVAAIGSDGDLVVIVKDASNAAKHSKYSPF